MISSVRNALPDMVRADATQGGQTIDITYLNACSACHSTLPPLCVMCIWKCWRSFKVVFRRHSQIFISKLQQRRGKWWTRRGKQCVENNISTKYSCSCCPLWKCRKPAWGRESWLVSTFSRPKTKDLRAIWLNVFYKNKLANLKIYLCTVFQVRNLLIYLSLSLSLCSAELNATAKQQYFCSTLN